VAYWPAAGLVEPDFGGRLGPSRSSSLDEAAVVVGIVGRARGFVASGGESVGTRSRRPQQRVFYETAARFGHASCSRRRRWV